MPDGTKGISAEKVLELYKAGHSQKDIAEQYKLKPIIVRQILKEKGYNTCRFRALDDHVMEMIILLISHGIQFMDIEKVCHISAHATRDVVARYKMQRTSKRARRDNKLPVLPEGFVQNSSLLERYLEGESFFALCKDLSLNEQQILLEFTAITGEQIQQHTQMLRKKVLQDYKDHFSPTAIARKHTISMSVVRRMVTEIQE